MTPWGLVFPILSDLPKDNYSFSTLTVDKREENSTVKFVHTVTSLRGADDA